MKVSLYRHVTKPVVAAVGTWDPIFPAHARLFEELREYALLNSLASLIIVIDPPPHRFMVNVATRPTYTDVHARIRIIRGFGIDAVLRIHFRKADLFAGAAELFAALLPLASVRELWLGMGQSLGRGNGGSFTTICALAAQRQIRVRVLPMVQISVGNVYELLRSGNIIEATLAVGRPPIRSRSRSARMLVAWAPGRYLTVPLLEPTDSAQGPATPVLLMPQSSGQQIFDWPGNTRYLAFVAGPADPG